MGSGRTEQLADQMQKSSGVREDLRHVVDDIEMKFEEKINAISVSTRHSLQESRQDMRQHVMRLLEERLRPISDKLAETAGDFKASKNSEKSHCERLQKTCSELAASQECIAQQCSTTAQDLTELRAGLRTGEIQRRHDLLLRTERDASYDRPAERQISRDDLHIPSSRAAADPLRFSNERYLEFAARHESTSAHLGNAEEDARAPRSMSQDRWSVAGSIRQRPRASFESVMAASPLCDVARRSRTPSPTPPLLGRRSEETWSTFGRRTQVPQWRSDSLGSPRGGSFGGKMSMTTSPRSHVSLRTARGSYF